MREIQLRNDAWLLNYDADYDVLYLFLADYKDAYGYEDECVPGIFVRREEDSDKPIGLMVMDYSKRSIPNSIPIDIPIHEIREHVNDLH